MKITIPHPCSQKPADMSPTTRGYYCQHCQKEVIDYRGYTREALIRELQQVKNPCGILTHDQLVYEEDIPATKSLLQKVAASLMMAYTFSMSHSAQAATSQDRQHPEIVLPGKKYVTQDTMPPTEDAVTLDLVFYNGSVEQRIKGARVIISSGYRTLFNDFTDSTGRIAVNIPEHALQDSIIVEVIEQNFGYRDTFCFEADKKEYLINVSSLAPEFLIMAMAGGISARRVNPVTGFFRRTWRGIKRLFR